ncbi:hypothetical protein ACQP2X_19930 [Actinoplanes sp. CA-131856]
MNDEVGPGKPLALTGILLTGLAVLSWEMHGTPVSTPASTVAAIPASHAPLSTLGAGAFVLALHLVLLHCFRHTTSHAILTATAALAVLICTALLVTGHQAQRMRSPRHESLDSLLLRDRAAVVSYEPSSAHITSRVRSSSSVSAPSSTAAGVEFGLKPAGTVSPTTAGRSRSALPDRRHPSRARRSQAAARRHPAPGARTPRPPFRAVAEKRGASASVAAGRKHAALQ